MRIIGYVYIFVGVVHIIVFAALSLVSDTSYPWVSGKTMEEKESTNVLMIHSMAHSTRKSITEWFLRFTLLSTIPTLFTSCSWIGTPANDCSPFLYLLTFCFQWCMFVWGCGTGMIYLPMIHLPTWNPILDTLWVILLVIHLAHTLLAYLAWVSFS